MRNLSNLYIDGVVGIGTTSPIAKLDVVGTGTQLDTSGYYYNTRFKDTTNSGVLFGGNNTANGVGFIAGINQLAFLTYNSGWAERMRITSGGNVLIGTTTDSGDKLRVSGDMRTDGTIKSYSGTNARFFDSGANITFHQFESYWITNSASSTATLRFDVGTWRLWNATAGGTVLSAKSSGNVGIGTNSPGYLLHVQAPASTDGFGMFSSGSAGIKGGIYLGYNTTAYGELYFNNSDNNVYLQQKYSSGGIIFGTNSSEKMRISQSGNLLIGTTTDAGYKLNVAGSVITEGINVFKNSTSGIINTFENYTGFVLNRVYADYANDGAVVEFQERVGVDGNYTRIGNYSNHPLYLMTNNSTNLTLLTNGNVGIGTTSPAAKLHVDSGLAHNTVKITTGSSGGTGYDVSLFLNGGANNSEMSLNMGIIGNEDRDRIKTYQGNMYFRTNDSENMIINSAGNVGIGTASPGAKLDVYNGNSRFWHGGTSYYTQFDTNNEINTYTSAGVISTMYLNYKVGGDVNIARGAIVAKSAGNVGIGTSSPAGKLSIEGDGSEYSNIVFKQSAAQEHLIYASTNFQYNLIGSSTPTWIWGQQSASERMRLNNTGLGIGTTSPQTELHVKGNNGWGEVRIEGQTFASGHGASLEFYSEGTALADVYASTDKHLYFRTNGTTERMRITSAGNVGIGTTSPQLVGAAWTTLEVQGQSTGGGGIVYTANNGASVKSHFYSDGNGGYIGTQTNNYFAFTSNNNERMRITSSGNVLIGTTTDSGYKLDVNGTARVGSTVGFQTAAKIHARRNGTNIEFGHNNTSSGYYGTIGAQGNNGQPYFALSADCDSSLNTFTTRGFKGNVITTDGAGSLMFTQLTSANAAGQSLTERMRIDSSGNVGIGTTSPGQKLHVVGDARIEGNLTINGTVTQIDTNTLTTEQWLVTNDGTGPAVVINQKGSQPVIDIQDDGSSVLYIADGGNVGIGTTSPVTTLDVNSGTSDSIAFFRSTDNRARIGVEDNDTAVYVIAEDSKASFGLTNTLSTLNLTVDTSGNVGIGTISPSGKLNVHDGVIRVTDSSTGGQLTISSKDGASTSAYIEAYNNTASEFKNLLFYGRDIIFRAQVSTEVERMRITADGNVGIGTTSPAQRLEVNGAILLQNNNELRWKDTGAIQRTIVRVNSSNELEYGWSGAGPVKFMGGGSYTERMRVHTNGNVGIGTTSPSQKLHVVGKALITDDVQLTGSNPRIDFNSNGASSLRFYDTTNASERVRIDTSGNVGIGTTTPVTKLDVNGSITAGGKIFYSKSYSSLDTTGAAIAGLTAGGNGSSALYEFTMYGGNSGEYQRVIYSCQNAGGSWYAYKVIDEGTNKLDVEASASGLTITFTFKARSATQYYSPRVHVEFLGSNIDTSYL